MIWHAVVLRLTQWHDSWLVIMQQVTSASSVPIVLFQIFFKNVGLTQATGKWHGGGRGRRKGCLLERIQFQETRSLAFQEPRPCQFPWSQLAAMTTQRPGCWWACLSSVSPLRMQTMCCVICLGHKNINLWNQMCLLINQRATHTASPSRVPAPEPCGRHISCISWFNCLDTI